MKRATDTAVGKLGESITDSTSLAAAGGQIFGQADTAPSRRPIRDPGCMNKQMKILIVDDFSTMRRIIKKLLQDLGFHNTSEADDGQTALPMLKSGAFDFLVTDWNMPGMDGLTLLKTVRSDAELRDLPVLMISAEAKREQIVVAAEAGVSGYVVKPCTSLTLKHKIESIFCGLEELPGPLR